MAVNSDYSRFVDYLIALPRQSYPFKIHDSNQKTSDVITKEIDLLLGSPSSFFSIIHVAGTNGKGSVVHKIAATLAKNGLKVGVYTSPHIHFIRERVKIAQNNEQMFSMISEESFLSHGEKVLEVIEKNQITPHFFEILTELAFSYFCSQKVDVVVCEVGIGGRFDSTNFITPILSVITSISYDHVAVLGKTLEEIASHKAGVIKKNVPVVLGPAADKNSIFSEIARKKAPYIIVECHSENFEKENEQIARASLNILSSIFSITKESIEEGIKNTPSCRFEKIGEFSSSHRVFPKVFILDVAHNEDGFKKLIKRIELEFPDEKVRFLIGMSYDKDIKTCLEIVSAKATAIHLPKMTNPKLLDSGKLKETFLEMGFENIFEGKSIEITLKEALEAAAFNDEILIAAGSFYIMSGIRNFLKLV